MLLNIYTGFHPSICIKLHGRLPYVKKAGENEKTAECPVDHMTLPVTFIRKHKC